VISTSRTDPPLVSVVVPAYNEEARLPGTLARIREAFDAVPAVAYELIVCDNNSTDPTASIAERAGCRVVSEPFNQISPARNTGAGAASGAWLLFIDADSWPSAALIGDMLPLLRCDSHIGCGSTLSIVDGPKWFKYTVESKNWSMRIFRWCPGAFILCRRDAFEEMGGFSTEHYIFEEIEFVKRLKALGRRRRQEFVSLHRHPFSTSGRKGSAYGFASWLRFALTLTLFQGRAVRDRRFAEKWYDGKR
jgi:glycosyltransferase involved in cell wall biosynthesis